MESEKGLVGRHQIKEEERSESTKQREMSKREERTVIRKEKKENEGKGKEKY